MAAYITTVADAVVTALNAATFSEPHKAVFAQRCYRPQAALEELGDKVLCRVVQRNVTATAITRGATKDRFFEIEIGVQRKVDFSNNDDADAMLVLSQEIEALFLGRQLTGTSAQCEASEIGPPYNLDHQEQMELFTTVIRLTFHQVTT